ncbi:serine/threonine protein kinase [Accumulibacter sp.]|uniref:serine/threonine protein kinase n=1 Tax=Accumulibacter sp. TaxID=2053492 RepID=UPI0012D102EB|nr:serine/threonine protein kinase [Accumulibacter sp.]MQM34306.1 serine/threonine protein kinase [Candidatus Accumulibacter phosphatis]
MSKQVGRFELIRELGRGAQSVVYLARDPQLQRQVAIKTLHFAPSDPQQKQQLLAEARIVSQLRHPSIVPIFEAAEEQGDLYLVFQHVPGRNLAEHLQLSGRLPAEKAIAIMQAILDAVAHAHAAGIIHRDLKPSNILIDDDGVPRVMDFGIASRAEGLASDGAPLSGTPAYMAPEYIAQRTSNERTDVFSAGLVFYELLSGQRAVPGSNIDEVMKRITSTDITLPAELNSALDERLVALLYRALARDPEGRYATAAQMRAALDDYLAPETPVAGVEARQSTIEFLLRRMRHKSDFPALSESVGAINRITSSENQNLAELSNTILKDFSLTNKILRMVNSVHYRQAGGGNISTVSRAIVVLGLDAVRSIAITVMLFEHLQNKDNSNQLKEEFLRAHLAGVLARDIGGKSMARGDIEQAFICSLFHNLGRLLSQYYFPDESAEIRRLAQQKDCSDDLAAQQVLGLSFEDLGVGIAQSWGFPRLIINSMRKLPPGSVRRPASMDDRLRVLAALSNDLCSLVADAGVEQQAKELRRIVARFGEVIDLDEQDLQRTLRTSFEQVSQFAGVLRLNLQQTNFGKQIRGWGGATGGQALAADLPTQEDGLAGSVLSDVAAEGLAGDEPTADGARSTAAGAPVSSEVVLMAGIQDVSNALINDFKLNDVLRIILETIYRAKGFKNVILCVRDGRSNAMLGRFGFGPEAPEIAKRFRFSLVFSADIFHAALANGADILISDTRDAKIAPRIPAWFRRAVTAETFVVFPLCVRGNAVAMIYADRQRAGEIVIAKAELSLLRTLRNQAVLAIKQSI